MSRDSKIEQETIINFNAAEKEAVVYTRDKAIIRKLDALVIEFPEVYKCIKETDIDKTYSVPKQYVNYGKPRRLSAKRKEQLRSQISKINCKRKK